MLISAAGEPDQQHGEGELDAGAEDVAGDPAEAADGVSGESDDDQGGDGDGGGEQRLGDAGQRRADLAAVRPGL